MAVPCPQTSHTSLTTLCLYQLLEECDECKISVEYDTEYARKTVGNVQYISMLYDVHKKTNVHQNKKCLILNTTQI
ncbi:hypothetical protein A3K91_1669 [Psychrobacter alimentarius]|uniref:Uncharacterized protein n=1 Tax=Psychrobacter alimentarius TaxID=261164 RepID=A0ABN4N3Z1_9GAMM|nr:hypothetical protein A3K91_1669 [Psychrobacter alimentarius]